MFPSAQIHQNIKAPIPIPNPINAMIGTRIISKIKPLNSVANKSKIPFILTHSP